MLIKQTISYLALVINKSFVSDDVINLDGVTIERVPFTKFLSVFIYGSKIESIT